MPRPIRWLHLSDLHVGCPGKALWWTVANEFEKSVKEYVARLGRPDLILFTGDLVFKGDKEEFTKVSQFLDKLLEWIGEPAPLIVSVPGNHDLARPQKLTALPFRVLDKYHLGTDDEDIRNLIEAVWTGKKPDSSFFDPLFGNYQNWFADRIEPQFTGRSAVKLHRSHFPGDFSLVLDLPGAFPITIVGLNSAWMQYKEGEFDRKLELPIDQFHAALPKDGGVVLQQSGNNFLLMHHPPSWLAPKVNREFMLQMFRPDRFALCLHGHNHELGSTAFGINTGQPRYTFQAPSLFGLEHYGSSKATRAVGYSWGQMGSDGEVRVWPLKYGEQGGVETFIWDSKFSDKDLNGIVIRPARNPRIIPPPSSPLAASPSIDLTDWLTTLRQQTDHINIQGISSGFGNVKKAGRYPIEQLYTPLRSRADSGVPGKEEGMRDGGTVKLSELLPRHRLLLIEGQPGSGKTTFLRHVASMLTRDKLGMPCPDGKSWSSKYLGLEATATSRMPVFLRLARLVPFLEQDRVLEKDDRERLLRLLDKPAGIEDETAWKTHWRKLIERGEVLFLLDGLDEVADEMLRDRVFNIFRSALESWSKCPFVVTSRPIQTVVLRQMKFHLVTIEPFRDGEIREFIGRWVNALYGVDEQARPHEGSVEYRGKLEKAIVEQPSIRRMARNPVMLTCLCVVHWNEGGLPDGRARVYRAVIRWLIAARTEQRKKAEFTDGFALKAFALLALRMMGQGEKDRKKAVFELQDAAEVLEPLIQVEFPSIQRPEDRREKARQWVRFECLGSGIIEEIGGNQLRFWHLTFQEYLAAFQLAWLGDGGKADVDWWPTVERHLDDVQWRETIDLMPGCLFDEGGPRRVNLLLERVLALREETPTLPGDARIAGIVGRLVSTLDAYDHRTPPPISDLYQTILDRSLEIFTSAGSRQVDVKTRIEAAEALGRGGDPRLAHPRDNMIVVPNLDGLSLGKYPVTVEEYRHFVDHGGYDEPRYWDAEGWSWRNSKEGRGLPDEWQGQLETPNRPVVGVSWYEARAYCRWLSEQWKESIRLPTSEEWEKSATPKSGEYPWGSEAPMPELANYDDGHVGHPTPVGVYPLGNGPYGHCDLAGNVWEWSEDGNSYARVLRGGSWGSSGFNLRCANRYDYFPSYGRDGFGFRCVRSG